MPPSRGATAKTRYNYKPKSIPIVSSCAVGRYRIPKYCCSQLVETLVDNTKAFSFNSFHQDSVICLEDQMRPQRTNTQKSLRSLNDVLGKSSTAGKETRAVIGHLSPNVLAAQASSFDHKPPVSQAPRGLQEAQRKRPARRPQSSPSSTTAAARPRKTRRMMSSSERAGSF